MDSRMLNVRKDLADASEGLLEKIERSTVAMDEHLEDCQDEDCRMKALREGVVPLFIRLVKHLETEATSIKNLETAEMILVFYHVINKAVGGRKGWNYVVGILPDILNAEPVEISKMDISSIMELLQPVAGRE